jgi:pimeloyl-ACP methyl ester carboxylesterase
MKEQAMNFIERSVILDAHRIHAREYPGEEPCIVLLHGFPDNQHLHDRLVPFLAQTRRVVTFDFLGWGESEKPSTYRFTASNQTRELDAVIEQLPLRDVVLVAHDASGPPAIDWALEHPSRVAGLVLLNTYYCAMPELRPPEAIWLFSTPFVRVIARFVSRLFGDFVFRRMYWWQVGRFFRDPAVRDRFLPILYQQFTANPSAHRAFFGLNEDLLGTLNDRSKRQENMRAFDRPIRIIFGDADPYLNRMVARRFHELFPKSELHLLQGARHFVQMDEPETVASLIMSAGPGK